MSLDEWIAFAEKAATACTMLGVVLWALIEKRGNAVWLSRRQYDDDQKAREKREHERWDPLTRSLEKISESLGSCAERLAGLEATSESVDKRLERLETKADGGYKS